MQMHKRDERCSRRVPFSHVFELSHARSASDVDYLIAHFTMSVLVRVCVGGRTDARRCAKNGEWVGALWCAHADVHKRQPAPVEHEHVFCLSWALLPLFAIVISSVCMFCVRFLGIRKGRVRSSA